MTSIVLLLTVGCSPSEEIHYTDSPAGRVESVLVLSDSSGFDYLTDLLLPALVSTDQSLAVMISGPSSVLNGDYELATGDGVVPAAEAMRARLDGGRNYVDAWAELACSWGALDDRNIDGFGNVTCPGSGVPPSEVLIMVAMKGDDSDAPYVGHSSEGAAVVEAAVEELEWSRPVWVFGATLDEGSGSVTCGNSSYSSNLTLVALSTASGGVFNPAHDRDCEPSIDEETVQSLLAR